MRYMLDTNICIYAIKKSPKSLLDRLSCREPGDCCISSITFSELMYGVEKSSTPERNRMALALFLSAFEVIGFDSNAAIEFGDIRASLERKGTPIGPLDTLIAAHARSRGLVLVTNNEKEFSRVDGLLVENWV